MYIFLFVNLYWTWMDGWMYTSVHGRTLSRDYSLEGCRVEECTFSYLSTCIGYKLPTFGEYMSVGGFLCALRAQGWEIWVSRQLSEIFCQREQLSDLTVVHPKTVRAYSCPSARKVPTVSSDLTVVPSDRKQSASRAGSNCKTPYL